MNLNEKWEEMRTLLGTEAMLEELHQALNAQEVEENLRWIDQQWDLGLFDGDDDEEEVDSSLLSAVYTEEDIAEFKEQMEEDRKMCQHCIGLYPEDELTWVIDRYGIPFKLVCPNCYEDVSSTIKRNRYGSELSYDELYGEDF